VVQYVTLVLSADKTLKNILGPYIAALLTEGKSEDEVIDLLSGIYDIKNPGDLMIIARAAKEAGAIDFARKILGIAQQFM